jgi:hypothetical protein
MPDNGKALIQSILTGEQLADFERVKAHHGIARNSDVIRFLIRKEARRVTEALPSIYDILIAYHAGQVTADEAITAIGGHRDTLS